MPDRVLYASQPPNPSVLVVGAADDRLKPCIEQIRQFGRVDVIEVASGQDALQVSARDELAAVIIGEQLPGMSPLELAALIRLDPRADDLPLIFVVEKLPNPALLKLHYRIGAVDVLTLSSADLQILLQKVRLYLQLTRKQAELALMLSQAKGENHGLTAENRKFRRAHRTLRQLAMHDALTGLPNRILFQDRFQEALKRARRNKSALAVAFIDLDGFKAVNDAHGHSTGDQMLRVIARRVRAALRASDTVARLGGDEFAVLLEATGNRNAALTLVQDIHRVIVAPATLASEIRGNEVEVSVGASIGVAVMQDHGTSLEELVNCADQMMYEAKRGGGGIRIALMERRERKGAKVNPLREPRRRDPAPTADANPDRAPRAPPRKKRAQRR